MLELSHEVNYAMQVTAQRLKELCDTIQDGVDKCQQRLVQIKSSKYTGGSVFRSAVAGGVHGSELSYPTSPRTAVPDGAGASGFTSTMTSPMKRPDDSSFNSPRPPQDLKFIDEVQSILRGVQRSALVLSNAYESFSTALQVDVKRQAPQQGTVFPNRAVPHGSLPMLQSRESVRGGSSCELPPILSNNQDGSPIQRCGVTSSQGQGARSNGRLTSMSRMSQVTATQAHDGGQFSPARPPPRARQSEVLKPTAHVGGSSAAVSDAKTVEALSSSLYFSFDALARALRAREAVAYVQRSPLEAQAVCVFGGKPRHPLTVRVALKDGPVGAVIKSGVALNVACEDPSIQSGHMLCFPIFDSPSRGQPIGALVVERNGLPAFLESEASLAQLWTVLATQFLTGYGADLTTLPYDPCQGILRQGGQLYEFLRRSNNAQVKQQNGGSSILGLNGFENMLIHDAASPMPSVSGGNDRAAIASILTAAHYSAGVSAIIASQTPPQLVFKASHRNHGSHIKTATDWKGHTEMLRYQNVLDVATYIDRLSDTWKRSTDDLQEMETEQIAQMQDMKIRMRKLKSVTGKLEQTERQVMEYKERYDVLKKELASLASE